MIIRSETPNDIEAIRTLHLGVFRDNSEAELVDKLRADHVEGYSLVACEDATVVGHCRMAALKKPSGTMFFGPLAVSQDARHSGVAHSLIESACDMATQDGKAGIFVFGSPRFYRKFGFDNEISKTFASRFSGPYLLFRPLNGFDLSKVARKLDFPEAFSVF